MTVFTKDNFPEIRSKPDWLRTWLIRVMFALVLGLLCISFYIVPILFYMDGTVKGSEIVTFSIFYYPIIIWLSYLGIKYMKGLRGNAIRHITINKNGVFYEKINGTTDSLLYKQLGRSPRFVRYDISTKTIRRIAPYYFGPTVLIAYVDGEEKIINCSGTDAGYSYFAGNYRELRNHFIQGVKLFRTDLAIAPQVYSEFYIHPETFEFERKAYWKTIVIAIIFILLVFLAIESYMLYRFGRGLIF